MRPRSMTTIALDVMREIVDCTESRPALFHPMRVGSATRCQVSPGNVALTGWLTVAVAFGVLRVAIHADPMTRPRIRTGRTVRTCRLRLNHSTERTARHG